MISVVILSCKRLNSLKRLVDSLVEFFSKIETYKNYEIILVDNGSGKELIDYAEQTELFSKIYSFEKNLGMVGAMSQVFTRLNGEYILFLEDDFIVDTENPFFSQCIDIFDEFPEIGIIRLKNQNNWWKPFRIIAPLRNTKKGTEFWTWLPSKKKFFIKGGSLNVWAAGSVLFRKVSYLHTGDLPLGKNVARSKRKHQGYLYENEYGRKYNKTWLAAKVKNIYPFVQPNDEDVSPGWGES